MHIVKLKRGIRCARKGGMSAPKKGDVRKRFEIKKGIIGVHERETRVWVPETRGGGVNGEKGCAWMHASGQGWKNAINVHSPMCRVPSSDYRMFLCCCFLWSLESKK